MAFEDDAKADAMSTTLLSTPELKFNKLMTLSTPQISQTLVLAIIS